MNNFQKCWWEQAKSDFSAYEALRRQGAAPCHQLPYLQMIAEKLSKAYFWRSGSAPKRSHVAFSLFIRRLQQVPKSERERIANIFAFRQFQSFQNWSRQALPLVYEMERLALDLANDGPNPEYPWP